LHYAAARKAPLEIVQALLTAHPAAAADRDADDSTPAELAAAHGAAADVVEALASARSGGDGSGGGDSAAGAVLPSSSEPCRLPNELVEGADAVSDATNAWDVPVPESVLDAAAEIFARCRLLEAYATVRGQRAQHMAVPPQPGVSERFFAVRAGGAVTSADADADSAPAAVGWRSDVAWISVDDAATHGRFAELFAECGLARRFSRVVGARDRPQLYSAFFVVRTACEAPNFHVDYVAGCGTSALTLITPIRTSDVTDSFQLLYRTRAGLPSATAADEAPMGATGGGGAVVGTTGADEGAIGAEVAMGTTGGMGRKAAASTSAAAALEEAPTRRYVYRRGRAIVFGSRFSHSTEPGRTADGAPHVYLCFTFGTDQPERWPMIAQTIDSQSRVLARPDGALVLSALGRRIEAEREETSMAREATEAAEAAGTVEAHAACPARPSCSDAESADEGFGAMARHTDDADDS
jgi:hypothetical protein